MPANFEDEVVTDLARYVEIVTDFTNSDDLLLRGQRSANWELTPTLSRLSRRDTSLSLTEIEEQMMRRFKREATPYLRHQPLDEWDWWVGQLVCQAT